MTGSADLLIRGACVLTLDPEVPELPVGDILISGGAIAAVAPRLDLPGAEIVDAAGCVALPGFVDSHWHLWTPLLRGAVDDRPETSWFPQKARLGPFIRPEDQEAAVRLSLVEALSAGITTVHDWAHQINDPADADANVRPHLEVRARARFSYATPSTHPALTPDQASAVMREAGRSPGDPMDMSDVVRLRERFADDLLTFGVALRGPARSSPRVWEREFAEARELGLPISMHCAGTTEEVARIRQVEVLASAGLLGPDLLLAHCNHVSAQERGLIAEHGVHVSMSPLNEVRYARSAPQLSELLDAGVEASFSLDSTAVVPADPFESMRVAYGHERVRTGRIVPARRLLELATIGGARGLALADATGSIRAGKRADLSLVRLDRPGTVGTGDPAERIVHSARVADVETVLVDGRFAKRDGVMVGCDVAGIVAGAAAAQRRVLERAGDARRDVARIVATAAR